MKPNNSISVICVQVPNKVPKLQYFGPVNKTIKTFEKYNKIFMYGICLSCVVTLLSIVCLLSCVSCPEDRIDFENQSLFNEHYFLVKQRSVKSYCEEILICKDKTSCSMTLEEVNDKIISDCPGGIVKKLALYNIDFSRDNYLRPGWLDEKIKVLESLNIGFDEIQSDCVNIEKGAFNVKQFGMKEIVFSNFFSLCPDPTLTRDMLSGLERVQHLYIQQYTERPIRFESNLLQGMLFSNIQIQGSFSNSTDIINLTGRGNTPINSVKLIDFRFNLNVREILNYSFSAVPAIESLYLDACSITVIEPHAFADLRRLTSVSLTQNMLIFLTEQTFINKVSSFHIANNTLHCDCSMSWLIGATYDKNDTQCYLNDVEKFNMYNFLTSCCLENATLRNESCKPEWPNSSTSEIPTTTSVSTTESIKSCDVKFEKQHTTMKIKSFDSNYIDIEFMQFSHSDLYLWIGTQNESNTRALKNNCVDISGRTSEHIENLIDNTPYVVCLIDPKNTYVSPLDCLAVKTLPPKEEREWLLNRDKPTTMSIVAGSVLTLIVVSIVTIYFILRRYPKLLKNENVVVIDPHKVIKNPASFFISDMLSHRPFPYLPNTNPNIPPGFTNSSYFSPIPSTLGEIAPVRDEEQTYGQNGRNNYDRTLNHVYMTPVIKRTRSFSEVSSGKNTLNSYVAITEPTSSQLMYWRLATRARGGDIPPPLPPPRKK